MSKITIGIIFILAGLCYGSLIFDPVYNRTLGYLVKNDWVTPPPRKQTGENSFGGKPAIVLYSLILIAIGLFLIWNHKE